MEEDVSMLSMINKLMLFGEQNGEFKSIFVERIPILFVPCVGDGYEKPLPSQFMDSAATSDWYATERYLKFDHFSKRHEVFFFAVIFSREVEN